MTLEFGVTAGRVHRAEISADTVTTPVRTLTITSGTPGATCTPTDARAAITATTAPRNIAGCSSLSSFTLSMSQDQARFKRFIYFPFWRTLGLVLMYHG